MVRGSNVAITWGKGCAEQKEVVGPVFSWEMGKAFCLQTCLFWGVGEDLTRTSKEG